MTEDEIYSRIDQELQGHDLNRGLWTRVFAEADGDEAKAKARYIKERAVQLNFVQASSMQGDHRQDGPIDKAQSTIYKSHIVVINSDFAKKRPLSKAELAELEQLKVEPASIMRKQDPKLEFAMAGMSVSEGGHEKVLGLLNTYFEEFLEAAHQLPGEFSLSITADTLANVDSKAIGYLFFDQFRPRGGWAISAKKRAAINDFNDEMDRRAWLAALYLKLVRSVLK